MEAGWVGEGEDSTAREDITGVLVIHIKGLPTPQDITKMLVILRILIYRPDSSDHMGQDPDIQDLKMKVNMGGSIHHHHQMAIGSHMEPHHQVPDFHLQDLEDLQEALRLLHGHGSPHHNLLWTDHQIHLQDPGQTRRISRSTAAGVHSTTRPPVITWDRIPGLGVEAEAAGEEEEGDGEDVLNRYSLFKLKDAGVRTRQFNVNFLM